MSNFFDETMQGLLEAAEITLNCNPRFHTRYLG